MNNRSRSQRVPRALPIVLCVLACFLASTARGMQDGAEARAKIEIGAHLEELGTTLRAAVMSGALDAETARTIFGRVARATKAAYVRDFGDGKDEAATTAPSAMGDVIRLTAPRPERIRVLLQAEFLRRDVPVLRDELDLDRDQATIVELLLDDYAIAYDLAAAPLREALVRYRSAAMNSYIAFALRDADVKLEAAVENVRRVDREEALARMTETLERIDRAKAEGLAAADEKDRERYEAWKRSMIAATNELDDRLAAIRARTTAQLAEMGRADAVITGDDLVRMARRLRADRSQLRADLVRSIEMIATEKQRGVENAEFDAALARVRIALLLPGGRLGGESMDLPAALAEVREDQPPRLDRRTGLDGADAMLRDRAPGIAASLDRRTDASIAREIAGLEYRSARDRIAAEDAASIFEIDEDRPDGLIDPYVDALRQEISASAAARDALLALLDESAAYLDETYPDAGLSAAYRAAALRRGFPVEMRRRWAERAVAAALDLEDLEAEVLEAILVLEFDLSAELTTLRDAAVAARVRRDPKLARAFIDLEFGDLEKDEIDEAMWREPEHGAFAALDERTERHLRGLLAPEQFDRLPVRKRADKWGEGKGKGEGEGKGKGKGEGKGMGKGDSKGKG